MMVGVLRRVIEGGLVLALAAALGPARAAADPITNRDYAIELYDGVAIGDTAQVGMGGAGAARIIGSAGALLNASAPVVRPTTDNDRWGWSYHLDVLTSKYSSDYDNNGTVSDDSGASVATAGASLRIGRWAAAFTVTAQTAPLAESTGDLTATALRGKLVVAYWWPRFDLALGAGAQSVAFEISPEEQDSLFSITGYGALAGATWLPRGQRYRLAAALETQVGGGDVTTERCDPNNCMGYILPARVAAPARLILGAAYRIGPTPWNQQVFTKFRDERSTTFAADVVVTGSSPDGHGLEAFGTMELQRAGRHPGISLRAGAEAEVLPGRLRLRAGSYWEPARFDAASGRLHATFGADLRVFEVELWGPRRGRISATGDIARDYRNLAVSVGFWH